MGSQKRRQHLVQQPCVLKNSTKPKVEGISQILDEIPKPLLRIFFLAANSILWAFHTPSENLHRLEFNLEAMVYPSTQCGKNIAGRVGI